MENHIDKMSKLTESHPEFDPVLIDFFRTDIGNAAWRREEILDALINNTIGANFVGNIYCLEIKEKEVSLSNIHDATLPNLYYGKVEFLSLLKQWLDDPA